MDPLSRGRGFYGKKEYQDALEAFTEESFTGFCSPLLSSLDEAVNTNTGNILLTALDHRAATYEKLDKLQLALRDAREMIVLKPNVSKGYLRCAKILQLKGEENLALKIYERGLRRVKIGEDDRPLLQEMLDRLHQKLGPPKALDPVLYFPPEVSRLIFLNLCSRDHVICLSVSKAWKCMLEGSHDLWVTLDIRGCKAIPTLKSIKTYCRRSNYTLNRIITGLRQDIGSTKMKYILNKCKNLQHLEYLGAGYLCDSLDTIVKQTSNIRTIITGPNMKISMDTIINVLNLCPQIVHAEFHHIIPLSLDECKEVWSKMDSLETLNLTSFICFKGARMASKTLILPQLINCIPNIRSASFHYWGAEDDKLCGDFGECEKLEHLNLKNSRFIRLPTLPKSLKHLNISASWGLWPNESVDLHLVEWPSLETLICGHNGDKSSELLTHLIGAAISAGTLKHLEILPQPDVLGLFPHTDFFIPSLEVLRITDCQEPEEILLSLLRRCTSLRRLTLESTRITGVGVKEMITKDSGSLEYLGLINCTEVSSDAINWARSKGTVVDCQFTNLREKQAYRHKLAGMI